MKKFLIATTALVATAGVAAADVNLSGGARFGVTYDDSLATTTALHSRFTLNIDVSTETDAGITFGARVRVRANTGVAAELSAADLYMKTSGLTVHVGNINGVIEVMPGMYAGSIGLTGLGYHNVVANSSTNRWGWDAFDSNGAGSANGVSVAYSAGDLTVMASYSDARVAVPGSINAKPARSAVSASYKFGGWTVAAAYQDSDTAAEDRLILTVGGTLGAANVGLAFADNNGNSTVALSGSFSVGAATTLKAFVTSETAGEAYGLGVAHSLGGATIKAGVVQTAAGTTLADLGVSFNF